MGTFYKLCTENHHCHCHYSQKLGQSTAMTADGWFKAWQGSGGSLLPRGQGSSNIQNLPQAAITVSPNGTSGERTGGSCKLPGHGAFTRATAAQAVMPVARWLSSVDGFQWSPCKLLRCFQRGWHRGLSVSSAFRSTNDANRFLAVCHRDMADTPRSFSKQDKAFPRYLNLVEGCFTLTLPDSSSLRACEQQTTTRGEYWSWREKKEKRGRLRCRGTLTEPLMLWFWPCAQVGAGPAGSGSGAKPGARQREGFWRGWRGAWQLVGISELTPRALDALSRQVVVEVLKQIVSIKPWLSHGPDARAQCSALCPVPRDWPGIWEQQSQDSLPQLYPKEKQNTSYQLGCTSVTHVSLHVLHLLPYSQESFKNNSW